MYLFDYELKFHPERKFYTKEALERLRKNDKYKDENEEKSQELLDWEKKYEQMKIDSIELEKRLKEKFNY